MASWMELVPPDAVDETTRAAYERDAWRKWDSFYARNGDRFFRDRHYFSRDFPELTTPGATVLELGCGAGNSFFPILELNPTATVYGCDYAPSAIAALKAREEYAKHAAREDAGAGARVRADEAGRDAGDGVDEAGRDARAGVDEAGRDAGARAGAGPAGREAAAAVCSEALSAPPGRAFAFVADITSPSDPLGPVPLSAVTVATCVFVLSALEPASVPTALRHLSRRMAPGGVVLVRDYASGDQAERRLRSRARDGARRRRLDPTGRLFVRGDGTRAYYFDPGELRAAFEACGFRALEDVEVLERRVENAREKSVMMRKFVQARFAWPGEEERGRGGSALPAPPTAPAPAPAPSPVPPSVPAPVARPPPCLPASCPLAPPYLAPSPPLSAPPPLAPSPPLSAPPSRSRLALLALLRSDPSLVQGARVLDCPAGPRGELGLAALRTAASALLVAVDAEEAQTSGVKGGESAETGARGAADGTSPATATSLRRSVRERAHTVVVERLRVHSVLLLCGDEADAAEAVLETAESIAADPMVAAPSVVLVAVNEGTTASFPAAAESMATSFSAADAGTAASSPAADAGMAASSPAADAGMAASSPATKGPTASPPAARSLAPDAAFALRLAAASLDPRGRVFVAAPRGAAERAARELAAQLGLREEPPPQTPSAGAAGLPTPPLNDVAILAFSPVP